METTAPVDSNKENSPRERAQRLFNKNLELEKKRRNAVQARVPFDPNAWQSMRDNYEAIVLEDHHFSERHDVEYALWQLHYRRIEELRAQFNAAMASSGSGAPPTAKGLVHSGPDRLARIQSQFKRFLSEATGFYHDLMMKIRAKYGLPLGYFSDDQDNQIPTSTNGNKSSEVKKGSVSCHRCFIYLGDLARYKGLYGDGDGDSKARDFAAASSYYMQASSIWCASGNPHHQLAILAGYANDELLTVYRYFRSLAAENPFSTARDNLIIAFEKNRQTYNQLVNEMKNATGKMPSAKLEAKGRSKGESRTPVKANKVEAVAVNGRSSNYREKFKPFVTHFIRMVGILFTRTSLETFDELLLAVKNQLLALLSSGPDEVFNFGLDAAECRLAIIRISAILIFTVHNVSRENESQSYADILQRSVLSQNAFTATFEFMGCILERCNQLKDPSKSFLLPGIGIFVEWLACHQNLAAGNEVEEKQVNARSFFWNRCISFMNNILSSGCVLVNEGEDESCFTNMAKYDESETSNRLALPEDLELRGFVPLLPAQRILDFSRNHFFGSGSGIKDNSSRIQRIVAAGKALANAVHSEKKKFYFDSKLKKFVFGSEAKTFDDDLCSGSLDFSEGPQMGMSVVPNMDSNIDFEEEDEVIVFKPFPAERNIDELSSKLASAAKLSSVGANSEIGIITNDQSSIFSDNILLQSSIGAATNRLSAFTKSMANGTSQYFPPVQPRTPSWPLNLPMVSNGIAGLQAMENRPLQVPELQGEYGISQVAAASLPSQFSIAQTGHSSSVQVLQSHLPSTDSFLPSGALMDVASTKQMPIAPPGLKKNPVSRPVRHAGPPPGFSAHPPKAVDDSLYGIAVRSETPQIPALDDYRWLDGYQSLNHSSSMNQMAIPLPSMDQLGRSFTTVNQFSPAMPSVNLTGPLLSSMGMANGSIAAESSPFPGKPVSTPQLNRGNQVLPEYSFSENMKYYGKPVQQFQNGNQQLMDSAQQYQGNAGWEGRFFV